jgi:hypothetical protein
VRGRRLAARASSLGGVIVSVIAIRPKARGFKPGRGAGLFKGDKNPSEK